MAIYTVGRGRVIVALLLSAALLLTIDLRGNPVLDTIRDGFSRAMSPIERATDVVTNPVQRAWTSYSNYDDLERENELLQEQLDRSKGLFATAEAAVIDYNKLLELSQLPSLAGIATAKAQVIGVASNNIDQIVEINKGSDDGIAVGMPVVNQAGLIGKITQVNDTSAQVMLITDPRFSVAVEILAGTGSLSAADDVTLDTTPSGATAEQLEAIQEDALAVDTTIPTGTTPFDVFGEGPILPEGGTEDTLVPSTDTSLPDGTTTGTSDPTNTSEPTGSSLPADTETSIVPGSSLPGDTVSEPAVVTTTTTTIPVVIEKEFGTLGGRGQGRLPQIRYLQNVPSLAVFEVGDLVETAGGSKSNAPPNVPIGRVFNIANRDGVAGPLLEIELNADLDKLNFVQVVLYRGLAEVPK